MLRSVPSTAHMRAQQVRPTVAYEAAIEHMNAKTAIRQRTRQCVMRSRFDMLGLFLGVLVYEFFDALTIMDLV